ncbi:MAG: phosphotransferase [Hyphomicrobiaceae bacterium]
MSTSLEQRCRELVVELKLGLADNVKTVVPLTGGVASDIARVDLEGRNICVKFALEQLRVAEEWHVPVRRNRAEYEWLQVANSVMPDGAIALYGRSDTLHGFAMEFVEGQDVFLWKDRLLAGQGLNGEAASVGEVLGRIHSATSKPDFDRGPFANHDDFRAIRIEPYLTFTASRRPEVSDRIVKLAENLYSSDQVLVHGDASPKNIIFRNGFPIVLDAECATMGDASFDTSFCINHLILKAVHLPHSRNDLLLAVGRLWASYVQHVDWEPVGDLETRVCALLPALMLARVDGKSPIEYLGDEERQWVRQIAIALIQAPTRSLSAFVKQIANKLEENQK